MSFQAKFWYLIYYHLQKHIKYLLINYSCCTLKYHTLTLMKTFDENDWDLNVRHTIVLTIVMGSDITDKNLFDKIIDLLNTFFENSI